MNHRRIHHELKHTFWAIRDDSSEIIVNPTTRFLLPPNYPFQRPTLLIHGIDHMTILKKKMLPYLDFCKTCNITAPCFCCMSITSKWSPCDTCKDVYREYILLKRYVFHVSVLHKLYQKNKPEFMIKEISSYLLL